MLTKQAILEVLAANKEYMQKQFGVEKIGLFGSYIRNEQTENSDIDLLVKMPSSFELYFDLKYFLEEKLHKSVDLGKEETMRRFIKKRIAKEIVYV